MPKTASKRADARRLARVRRAHQTSAPTVAERPISRRIPAAAIKRGKPRGLAGVIRDFPVATTLFTLLLVGSLLLIAHQQRLGPWAPPGPPAQATCNLQTHICNKAPLMKLDAKKLYTATIKTAKGDIILNLDAKNAPIAVNNFVFLVQQGYYTNTYFWRIEQVGKPSPLTNQPSNLQLAQGGSVTANGKDPNNPSPPGYSIKDDSIVGDYTLGAVAMAKTSAPNSGGAQFFICTGDDSQALTNKVYPIFAHITDPASLAVAQKLTAGDKMLSVSITVTNPPTPTPSPSATATPKK